MPQSLSRLNRSLALLALAGPALVAAAAHGAPAASPSSTIDAMLQRDWQKAKITPAPPCDDRAFARRVYLDLAGRIPTPAEADTFATDKSPDKRPMLVDKLLASPEYAQHMRDVFDVMLMGRKPPEGQRRRRRDITGNPQGARKEWLAYLERCFAQDRPWDRMMREMILARPDSPDARGAVWFLYARKENYQEIAEAVAPAVFGVQVQCAQCHDHKIATEIKQKDYWGLVAFFNRSKNKDTKEGPRIAEAATGGFSNFANLSGESFPATLTFFGREVKEERPADGAKVEDKPELYRPLPSGMPEDEPKVPKFSRREQFVESVVNGNPLVARAAVNRFWALLMGRGFVHPVDKMDSKHPAAHPELLDALAKNFEQSGFDTKRLVRSIVLSRAYQLGSTPVAKALPESFAYGLEKPLTAEMLYRSLMVAAKGKPDAEDPELQAALPQIFPDLLPEENVSTLRQAMYLTNNPALQKLAQPKDGNTAERLAQISDLAARTREMYRIALEREPQPDELKVITAYMAARPDQKAATAQAWWAILAGAEFRSNH